MQATVRVLATILTLALPAAPGLAAQFPEAPAGPLSPLVLDDLHHFLEALEQLPGAADSVAVLQAVYIDRGTTGLKEFTARKGLTTTKLLDAIRADPEIGRAHV